MAKVVTLFSGGLDSAVLAHKLALDGHEVIGLSIDYGQRHVRELLHAVLIAKTIKMHNHISLSIPLLKSVMGGSSLTDDSVEVPRGHYADDAMKTTVVPNRNMILIAIAGAAAVSHKADAIAFAAHRSEGQMIYPDCSKTFAKAMDKALAVSDWHKYEIWRPFIDYVKADIVSLGIQQGTPLELTWSCYESGLIPCGECGTCVKRAEAFRQANVRDFSIERKNNNEMDS